MIFIIFFIIIAIILIVKWVNLSDTKLYNSERLREAKILDKSNYFKEGYQTRPIITGDHFLSDFKKTFILMVLKRCIVSILTAQSVQIVQEEEKK